MNMNETILLTSVSFCCAHYSTPCKTMWTTKGTRIIDICESTQNSNFSERNITWHLQSTTRSCCIRIQGLTMHEYLR